MSFTCDRRWFSLGIWFPPLTATILPNFFENGVKHHKPKYNHKYHRSSSVHRGSFSTNSWYLPNRISNYTLISTFPWHWYGRIYIISWSQLLDIFEKAIYARELRRGNKKCNPEKMAKCFMTGHAAPDYRELLIISIIVIVNQLNREIVRSNRVPVAYFTSISAICVYDR